MTKQQMALVAWLASPIAVVAVLCWMIAASIGSRERQALRYPAVGAGAGDTGGANAIGEMLAGKSASHGRQPGPPGDGQGSRREIDLGGRVGRVEVWLPPGYDDPARAGERYAALVLLAGDGAIGPEPGSWRAEESAAALIERGVIPPTIVVGAAWSGGPSGGLPGAEVEALDALATGLRERLRLKEGASLAIGGGGAAAGAALAVALRSPADYGGVLLESLPLGGADGEAWERWLDAVPSWPARVWLGVGDHELGREPERAGANAARRAAVHRIGARLIMRGRGPEGHAIATGPGETADASAWSARLAGAMAYLFGPGEAGDAAAR